MNFHSFKYIHRVKTLVPQQNRAPPIGPYKCVQNLVGQMYLPFTQ
jgi:hypothetical protein